MYSMHDSQQQHISSDYPQAQHLNTSAETYTLRGKNGNFTSRPVDALDAQRLPAKGLLMTTLTKGELSIGNLPKISENKSCQKVKTILDHI